MIGFDNPSKGLDLINNSTDLPPPMRFLHPDCKEYSKKYGTHGNPAPFSFFYMYIDTLKLCIYIFTNTHSL